MGTMKIRKVCITWIGVLSLFFAFKLQAQTLFQNNNNSCEDIQVIGFGSLGVPTFITDASIACGQYNDDTALGQASFPDCATVSDPITGVPPPPNPDTNSILINTGAHGQNCINAGEPNNQFAPPTFLQNSDLQNTGPGSRMGTIASGNLNNGPFDDLAMVMVEPPLSIGNRSVQSLFSLASGGFGSGPVSSSRVALLGLDGIVPLLPFPVSSPTVGGPVSNNWPTDRSMVLLDCDGDGLDESAVGVRNAVFGVPADLPGFIVLQNNGAGLLDGDPASFLFNIPRPSGASNNEWNISLAFGNFLGDGNLDIAVAFDQENPDSDEIALCRGLGSCTFSCPSIIPDPNLIVFPGNPEPVSVASGDFNGDGLADLAVGENNGNTGPQGQVEYFFSNGADLNSWIRLPKSLALPSSTTFLRVVAPGQFSTGAIQSGIDEVAVTFDRTTFNGLFIFLSTGVDVLTSDGAGGINDPETLAYSIAGKQNGMGLDAQDFDHCGGDDIIALNASAASTGPPPSLETHASLFLNTNEPPDVAITSFPTTGSVDGIIDLTATCTDPTFDDRNLSWSVVGPAGAAMSFNPPSSILVDPVTTGSTQFTADTEGDYVITVTCTDFCGLQDVDSVTITLTLGTQGGCIANQLMPDGKVDGKWMYGLLAMIPVLFLFRRLRRKHGLLIILIFSILLSSSVSHALTKSFSVNTFEPTIDDSEFFTVYASPTMLKRNYHVGFYLDIAGDPYEFGDNNFNRVGGIVDNLLTGNVVGSYAVLDWLSVGVLVPVHFWEGIRSPNLALDENNFALGDVQLVLKLRLLDREKHHIGIAVVPFAIFPTSTDSTDFLGNGSFNGGGKVVIDVRIKERVSIALNLGYVMRSNITDVGGNNLDDQFLTSLGISVDILKNKLKVITEGQMATVAKDFFGSRRTTPAEARIGFRYTFANNHDINAGAGFGLSNGIGSPAWRGFIGYTYTKRPIAEVTEAPPPVSDINVGDELTLADKIYFEFDKAVIRDISKPTLDKIAGFLKAHPEVTKIKIDGHTCDLGSLKYNQGLSERRAKAVATYLEGQGISADRIGTVEGFGETKPLVPNSDEAHREQNRRVQIFVEAVAGK